MHNVRASSHFNSFSFRCQSFPADVGQHTLRLSARSRCLTGVKIASLNRATSVPSQALAQTTTGFSEIPGSQIPRRFLSSSREKTRLMAAFPGSNTVMETIEPPESVSSPLNRTMANTLPAYLQEQKTGFLKDKGASWTIVTGNEAGDLDSLASSIGFAWLLSHIPTADTKAIALITTHRKDFVLRAENLYALEQIGIREDFKELLCPEDLPQPNACDNFALVDHNTLQPTDGGPNVRVTAIIDHHADEGKHLDTASPRIIEPSGSCASLVTRAIRSYPTLQIPPQLAVLLLSAIVIDTDGLRKGGKAVDVDYEMSTWLLPRTNVENVSAQVTENPQHVRDEAWIRSLSDTLHAKKFAIFHLSTRDLLRRDYKEYDLNLSSDICGDSPRFIKAGLATVPMPLTSFFSPLPNSTVLATQEWMKERGLSVLGVLTSYKSKRGHSKREALWVIDGGVCGDKLPQVFFDGFEANQVLRAKRIGFERFGFSTHAEKDGIGGDEAESECNSADDAESESVDKQVGTADLSPFAPGLVARVYRPKNTTATRKQVAPIMKEVLEG